MPILNKEVVENSHDHLEESLTKVLLMSAQTPTVVCGINRKTNIGNFENVDIYCGVSIPLLDVDVTNIKELQAAVENAAEKAFAMTSKETGDRYKLIKGSIAQAREAVQADTKEEESF